MTCMNQYDCSQPTRHNGDDDVIPTPNAIARGLPQQFVMRESWSARAMLTVLFSGLAFPLGCERKQCSCKDPPGRA